LCSRPTARAPDEPGFVRAADGGTLFLDEIGDRPLPAQASLLRVLQEREVTPVGAVRAVVVDARVISATHQPLASRVEGGAFRADLLARLRGFSFTIPPLRDRRLDLGELIARLAPPIKGFRPDAALALLRHDFAMNVRELKQALDVAAVLSEGGVVKGGRPARVRHHGAGGGPARRRRHRPARRARAAARRDRPQREPGRARHGQGEAASSTLDKPWPRRPEPNRLERRELVVSARLEVRVHRRRYLADHARLAGCRRRAATQTRPARPQQVAWPLHQGRAPSRARAGVCLIGETDEAARCAVGARRGPRSSPS
jgi:DNA-binding NtrC family response regulator